MIGGEDGELVIDAIIDGSTAIAQFVQTDATNGDVIRAGAGYNIVFGDSGEISAAAANAPQFGTQPITLGLLTTIAPHLGGNDNSTTGVGKDILRGGDLKDMIVANDISRADAGFDADTNAVTLITRDGDEPIGLTSKAQVAVVILDRAQAMLAQALAS